MQDELLDDSSYCLNRISCTESNFKDRLFLGVEIQDIFMFSIKSSKKEKSSKTAFHKKKWKQEEKFRHICVSGTLWMCADFCDTGFAMLHQIK